MPFAKNCNLRYQVLDRYLQSSLGCTLSQLRDACNNKLEISGFNTISANSKNTILSDMEFMKSYYNAPIESTRIGRSVYYKYSDPHFSIFKSDLPEDDLLKINTALEMIGSFEGRANFEWVEDVKLRLNSLLKDSRDSQVVVSYDNNVDYNMQFHDNLTLLYDAIICKKALKITYQTFKSDSSITSTFHPYHLRQYNNRWFLFGVVEGYSTLTNYALDRIKRIEPSHIAYCHNKNIIFEDYFYDMVGVSKDPGKIPEAVLLKISKETYPYIATKPIHGTQHVVVQNEDYVIIQIEVIPNFELEQQILSYGELMSVIAPQNLRDKIANRIRSSLEQYQSVQLN